ncbi:MAG: rhodanese-like domain-containing protein [Methylomicrobium sp.]
MNSLTRDELKKMQDNREDFLLLNVLSEDSFHKGHIPGSKNAPVSGSQFLQKVASLAGPQGKDRPIVTYCAGFHCNASREASNHLTTAGYKRVSAFEGGMEDWINAGYPIES